MVDATLSDKKFILPTIIERILQAFLIIALPLVLILANAGILMIDVFMTMEYNRPGFPADDYGFTTDERELYGGMGLAYLFNKEDISYLGDLTFPDGSQLFNDRELSHMHDVKEVTKNLSTSGFTLIGIYLACAILLGVTASSRKSLYVGLWWGGMWSIVVIILGLSTVAINFDWLFTQFHGLFFEGDTWIFFYSDTLIRLYPEQFWIDAFAVMFGGALLEGGIIAGVARRRLRKSS